ncbi:MAG: stage II sporulation protein E [Clostridiales bacterium]|jgi:stage II sporulation protein E|nr:stage II sporulation protein E [Clostridiales bacterium]
MDHTVVKTPAHARGRFILTRGDAARFVVSILGFFIGRAVLFDKIDPIAVGFLATLIGTGHSFYATAAFLLIGAATKLSGIYFLRYVISVSLLCLVNLFVQQYLIKQKSLYFKSFAQGIAGAICTLIGGLASSWLDKLDLYLVFISMMESALVFGLVFVLKKAALILTAAKKKNMLSNEEMISLAVLFGCIIAGAADIYVGVVSLRYVLCFYFVLTAAYLGDASVGAAAGMLTGILLHIAGFWNIFTPVILAMAGLAGGLFKGQGKIGILLGFALLGAGAFYYLDASHMTWEALYSLILAGLCFLLTPRKFNFYVTAQINPVMGNAEEYLAKMKSMAAEKLIGFAESFEKLARTFDRLQRRAGLDKTDASALIDDAVVGVCSQCAKRPYCWEDNFYATYQYVYGILDQCEKKGWLEMEDVPEEFLNQCVETDKFIENINRLFEIYKTNLNWKKNIAESRDLVSQQLVSVAGIVKSLAEDMEASMRFKEDLEEKVLTALSKNKIEVDRVIVLENKEGKYEVSISHKFYYDKRRWNRTVLRALNGALQRRMQLDEEEKGERYVTKFLEEKKLRVSCGVARLAKGRKGESGDSYSFMELKNGECLLALSDGMGAGRKAREESAATVDLLESFIESGFDKTLALKIINSVLVLRNGEESFATLDICSMDLYRGEAEFIKIGAAATFLLRDGKVFVIRSTSLPIGMLKDVDMEISRKRLNSNDIILMVTDGLLDITETYGDKEDWIANALRECRFVNPQDIADYILFEAQRLSEGFVQDDMTVLAARVWEK